MTLFSTPFWNVLFGTFVRRKDFHYVSAFDSADGFFASRSGPGQAVPRASTDFATDTDFNSSAVITLLFDDLKI